MKETLRIVEEHHVIVEDGWIKLSPLLMQTLGIRTGDMISFLADGEGVRVTGGPTPPYVHAATEKPPTKKRTPSIRQMPLFETGPSTRRRK